MTTIAPTSRTTHLLELMKKGDDAFNSRDFAAMSALHDPNMIAHVTGNAAPIYGQPAHAAAMQQFMAIFSTSTCTTIPTRSSSEAGTGSPWLLA
jgi:hypothetical protein